MKKYNNYVSNLNILKKAELEDFSNEFILSGIIDKFFIQFELGWKVLKELLRYEGKDVSATGSPRSIIKAAYSVFNFIDETTWLDMLKARNDLSHMYNSQAARKLVEDILNKYIPAFLLMQEKIEKQYGDILAEEDL